MKSYWGKALAVALLSAGGAAGVATMAWAGDRHEDGKREMHVIFDAGAGDRLEIDDLDELAVGDSRSYSTGSGKTAVVTRDEEGYEVELDGKTIRIGDELGAAHDHHAMKMKRIEMGGDGKTKSFVISDDPDREVVFIEGRHGEHGFAFDKMASPPPFVIDGLVSRLEKNEKFRSLDDATQQLVREAIRESSPELKWVGIDDPGERGAMKVIVRERSSKEDGGEEE